MGDIEQQPKKIESGTLFVSPFRDPVGKAEIASTEDNPLYGYYGYVRNQGRRRHPGFDYVTEEPPYNSEDTKHPQETKSIVYPVHKGTIVQVRFGRNVAYNKPSYVLLKLNLSDLDIEVNKEGMTVTKIKNRDGISKKKIKTIDGKEITITTYNNNKKVVEEVKVNGNKRDVIGIVNKKTKETEYYYYDENIKKFKCPLIESIKDNHFYYETCSKCTNYFKKSKGNYEMIRSSCYGVQVWLKMEIEKRIVYAFYAHLSELSADISAKLVDEYNKDKNKDTYNITYAIIDLDTSIGKSGRTGNACDAKVPHLHFECRTGIETKTQVTPNNIVKTKFMAWDCLDDEMMISIGNPLDEIPQEKWYGFLDVNQIIKIIGEKKAKKEAETDNNKKKQFKKELLQLESSLIKRWDNRKKTICVQEIF